MYIHVYNYVLYISRVCTVGVNKKLTYRGTKTIVVLYDYDRF